MVELWDISLILSPSWVMVNIRTCRILLCVSALSAQLYETCALYRSLYDEQVRSANENGKETA